MFGKVSIRRLPFRAFGIALGIASGIGAPAIAASYGNQPFLVAKKSVSAPAGFSGVCTKYTWACATNYSGRVGNSELMQLANNINKNVNLQTRQVTDYSQYRQEELWALPTARGGDCEDFALLKKLKLLEAGVSSDAVMIATVLDRKMKSHAVLVLRASGGDYVLDNLNDSLKPWKKTGYTFLRMQNPRSPGSWDTVFAGC